MDRIVNILVFRIQSKTIFRTSNPA